MYVGANTRLELNELLICPKSPKRDAGSFNIEKTLPIAPIGQAHKDLVTCKMRVREIKEQGPEDFGKSTENACSVMLGGGSVTLTCVDNTPSASNAKGACGQMKQQSVHWNVTDMIVAGNESKQIADKIARIQALRIVT